MICKNPIPNMKTKYIIKRTSKAEPDYSWKHIECTLQMYGNLTKFEDREYIWEKISQRKTSEIIKGLEIEVRLLRKSDQQIYGVEK